MDLITLNKTFLLSFNLYCLVHKHASEHILSRSHPFLTFFKTHFSTEESYLLGYDSMRSEIYLSMFRKKFLHPSSGCVPPKCHRRSSRLHCVMLQERAFSVTEMYRNWLEYRCISRLVFGSCYFRISRRTEAILTIYSWLSSVPSDKYRNSTSNGPRFLSSKSK
jgi:hypothetical protein